MMKKIEKKFPKMATIALFAAVAVAIIGFKYNYMVCVVPTGSMLPTLSLGEIVFTEKIRNENDFQRGDIIVFNKGDMLLIKRMVGMPGDTIEIKDGVLYLNGEPQTEEYLMNDYPMSNYGPYTVPEGHYFMMGDNRNNSGDSRIFGAVPYEVIVSKALFHYPSVIRSLSE